MMAQGMRALTGAGTTADAWRRFFDAVRRRRHQSQLRRLSALRLRVRDRRRDRPPADGHRRPGVADLRLRAVSESARRGELRAAPAGRRADRRRRARQPEHRQQRLRSGDLPRGGSLRRRRHALEHDAAGVAAADEDHQHPEHEGSRRDRRHRLPEEHRLRQLLQRRAHAPARQVPHLLGRRHAGLDRAAALEDRAADHGRPARRLARRSVRADDEYVFYPRQIMFGTDPVAIDRLLLDIIDNERRAHGAISIWDRSPGLAEDGRHARARRRSQRQHHHPRAGTRGVRLVARPRRVRSRQIKVQDVTV